MKCSFRFEKALRAGGSEVIAGIDEAGRGPLAGPVVVAAVILPARFRHRTLTDSKQLTLRQREEIYAELTLRDDVCWAVCMACPRPPTISSAVWRKKWRAAERNPVPAIRSP